MKLLTALVKPNIEDDIREELTPILGNGFGMTVSCVRIPNPNIPMDQLEEQRRERHPWVIVAEIAIPIPGYPDDLEQRVEDVLARFAIAESTRPEGEFGSVRKVPQARSVKSFNL